jgi:hypothetical protein
MDWCPAIEKPSTAPGTHKLVVVGPMRACGACGGGCGAARRATGPCARACARAPPVCNAAAVLRRSRDRRSRACHCPPHHASPPTTPPPHAEPAQSNKSKESLAALLKWFANGAAVDPTARLAVVSATKEDKKVLQGLAEESKALASGFVELPGGR